MISRRSALAFTAMFALAPVLPAAAADRIAFDKEVFDAARAAGQPVLIDVYADWCPTCRAQHAAVSDLVERPKFSNFIILVIDYDTQKDLMRSFGAQQRSTLIAFKGQAEVGRIVGDTRPAAIEALLSKAI